MQSIDTTSDLSSMTSEQKAFLKLQVWAWMLINNAKLNWRVITINSSSISIITVDM